MTNAQPNAEYDAFKTQRHAMLTAPHGSLSMTAMPAITATVQTFDGVPGSWSRSEQGNSVLVSATVSDHVEIDGQLIEGAAAVTPVSKIRFSDTVTASVGQEVDGTWFLQVSDRESPNLKAFVELETYAYDEAWVVRATYRPRPVADRPLLAGRLGSSELHRRESPGEVDFSLLGQTHQLAVYATPSEEWVTVNFTDETSGSETPSAGRILVLPAGSEGEVIVDFNRAMLLPHESSSVYPCPIPPAGNHLRVAVRAGEQKVRFSS